MDRNKEPENWVNKMTIKNLTNDAFMKRWIERKETTQELKKEQAFYKKRIHHLSKQLLQNEAPGDLFPDVQEQYDAFLRTCIYYFKSIDNHDILQEEYKEYNDDNNGANKSFDLIEEERKRVAFDKAILRRHSGNKGLDGFVKRVVHKEAPVILPKQKNVDLKDPVLRTKGTNVIPDSASAFPVPLSAPLQQPIIQEKSGKKPGKKPGKKKNIVTIYET
jgi:hypothetical protein